MQTVKRFLGNSAPEAAAMAGQWHTRAVVASDYEQWSALYHGYRKFYRQEPSEQVVNTVWSWILDPNHVTQALVAVRASETGEGEELGGLAHHRQWPQPLLGTTGLYLDDLFTRPDLRGQGIATMLINELADMAKKEGLNVVRWTTAHDNTTARRLYDSIGQKTNRITYDKALEK